MNRCRCRRRLRRCLDDWANMYHHGVNADVVPAVKVGGEEESSNADWW